ncbi:MAG: glucokinase [Thalassovita sp.]|nr:glucokinase [Thalassovita sp.]
MRLVADIGGTNSRFALSMNGEVQADTLRRYANDEFASPEQLIETYLQDIATPVREMVLAVAGPGEIHSARLTNRPWRFEAAGLASLVGCDDVWIINDLAALGYAVPRLPSDRLTRLIDHPVPPGIQRQYLVIGIGTGFNVSPVADVNGAPVCLTVEAGHASLPQVVAAELETHQAGLSAHFPTIEHLFSGRGLSRLYGLISGADRISAQQIIAAQHAADPVAGGIADLYARLIGLISGEMAQLYLPRAGVFFAGSIARELFATRAVGQFHRAFSCPSGVTGLSVSVILDDAAALLGCAAFRTAPG